MDKKWTDEAWNGYQYFIMNDKKSLKKVNDLIKDIERNGNLEGIGKPEALKGNYSGFYSRHIDDKERIVYVVNDNALNVILCGTHYNDK